MEQLLSTLTIGGIGSVLGIILREIWVQYAQKRKQIELDLWKVRIESTERRLREFLWPIYIRLQRDNTVWTRILARGSGDEEASRVARQVESDIIIPNHVKIIELIERGMHFIKSDSDLERATLAYMRHIDIYRSLRAAGIFDKDPIMFDEPYPREFFELIKLRVNELQKNYDAILDEKIQA
ncbi:hypothetical protein ACFPPF_09000 [Xenophilus aerolatus]|nr:hypothetical protein [Xenophilus aerolatus]